MSNDKVMVYLPAKFSPVTILQIRDENEFEEIIEDWQRDSLGKKYVKVDRLGGPQDKARDVVCTDLNNDIWIYQCKHYKDKLSKEETFPEMGKCCYYCYKKDYKIPKKYFFVSPRGVTTPMKDLFDNPERLKAKLINEWDTSCRKKITKTTEIILEGEFRSFVDTFDFSIFYFISPEEFVEDFKKSEKFEKWLGRYVKPKKVIEVPEEIRAIEFTYIKKILDAYGDYLGKNIEDEKKLKSTDPDLWKDFEKQRRYFYSAEYLSAISRDSHPTEFQWFEHLKKDFYEGIIETISEDAKNGFERLKNVLKRACVIPIDLKNPLIYELDMDKRKGMCHELANEKEEIKWKNQKE